MNLKMVVVVLAAAGIVVLLLLVAQTDTPSNTVPNIPERSVSRDESVTASLPSAYQCEDDVVLSVDFAPSGESLTLTTPAGEDVSLAQRAAASGAQYENLDGNIVLYTQGDEAFLEELGEVSVTGCTATYGDRDRAADKIHNPLIGRSWEWTETVYEDGATVSPDRPYTFIINFADKTRMSALTDCNNLLGTYELGDDQTITFSEMTSTSISCTDSQEDTFQEMLQQTSSWRMVDDQLRLNLQDDGGSIIFAETEVIMQ